MTHDSRLDFKNKEIEIIVETDALDDTATFIPAEVLEEVAKARFVATFASYTTDARLSPEARSMGVAQY